MLKKSIVVFVFACTVTLNVLASPDRSILLLGDSLSAAFGMKEEQGWVYLLNQQFTEQNSPYHIINASISGETTAGGLARLPKLLANNSADYLMVELGGNDGLRGFPPALIKKNLSEIIQQAKSQQVKVILVEIKIPPNYGPRYTELFINNYHQLASEESVPLIPFFLNEIATDTTLMQNDGIHPNVKAQPLIAKIMAQHVKQLITED